MSDFLFKFGNYVIPDEFIIEDGYDCTPNQRQDVNPWTDANGETHRNVVPHTKTDITITFRKLSWNEAQSLLNNIVNNYITYSERDAICTYLDTETLQMKSGHFYLDPSFKMKVHRLNAKFDSFTMRFTEY